MAELKEMFDQWLFADQQLKMLKKKELELRKQITKVILHGKKEGTVTNEEIEGYIVKATAKLTRKVVNPELLIKCGKNMTGEEKSVYEWTWVPKINLENYRKYKALFYVREQVRETPAAPSLTIEKADISIAEHDAQINPAHAENLQSYQETTQGFNQEELNQGDHLEPEQLNILSEDDEPDFNW